MKTLLKGHTSQETAYVVEDYPYGFRLRCKMRHWVEYHKTHGFRHVTQTSNPKRDNTVWNAPKKSTYCKFGVALFLDDVGHVHSSGMTEYSTAKEAREWLETYREALSEDGLRVATEWVEAKELWEKDPEEFKKQYIQREVAKLKAGNE